MEATGCNSPWSAAPVVHHPRAARPDSRDSCSRCLARGPLAPSAMVVMGVAPRGRPEGCRDFQRQLPGGPSIRIALAVALLVLSSCAAAVKAPHLVTPPDPRVEDLSAFFGGFEATFVLLDLQRQELTRFNPERAARRQPPCSTFKVPNALIGLETGVLSGPEHAMKWDGTHYEIETWNQDQTLRTAIRWSVVWYFQRVAASIGEQRMRQYLHAIPYGNEDISGGLTRFWCGRGLAVLGEQHRDGPRASPASGDRARATARQDWYCRW